MGESSETFFGRRYNTSRSSSRHLSGGFTRRLWRTVTVHSLVEPSPRRSGSVGKTTDVGTVELVSGQSLGFGLGGWIL